MCTERGFVDSLLPNVMQEIKNKEYSRVTNLLNNSTTDIWNIRALYKTQKNVTFGETSNKSEDENMQSPIVIYDSDDTSD